ncbi:hypothetical protein F53441_4136 [Fusarium austroafricanum]|uniref:Uncharacterized protein n=1 Tax=Fusarium austroafricanum TaxID=2364996 RepID=A0A8H4KP27_9HYPO|nr:hypothetical protein F53441_4136 [Fusarium austroafricanum]
MPVTVSIASRDIKRWPDRKDKTPDAILKGASTKETGRCKEILQSDFSIQGSLEENHVTASQNGLVWAAFYAYSQHHHLTIRPEDVCHSGQKELVVQEDGFCIRSVNYGRFAQTMSDKIAEHIKDPSLRDWVLPSFTTTTASDRVVGSVLLMGAMKAYFKYGWKAHRYNGQKCVVDGVSYPEVNTSEVAGGFVTVPVKINDNGAEYDCRMLAGSIGIQAHASPEGYVALPDDEPKKSRWFKYCEAPSMRQVPPHEKKDDEVAEEEAADLTGIQPVTGWMIYLEEKDDQ